MVSGNSTRSQLTSYSWVLVCLFFLLTARIDFEVRIRALCFAKPKRQKLRAHHGLQQLPARHLLVMHFSTTAPAAFSASRTQDFRCAVNCSSLPGVTWGCLQFVPAQTECGHHCHTPQPVHLADFHQAACDQLSSTAFAPAKTTTEHPCGCCLCAPQLQAHYPRHHTARQLILSSHSGKTKRKQMSWWQSSNRGWRFLTFSAWEKSSFSMGFCCFLSTETLDKQKAH